MSDDNLTRSIALLQELMAQGWTAAAISRESGVNQITIGNIKNGKASRVTDKVYDRFADLKSRLDAGKAAADASGRKSNARAVTDDSSKTGTGAATPSRSKKSRGDDAGGVPQQSAGLNVKGMISTEYVPVDIVMLQGLIDGLISRFAGAIEELEHIKTQLRA